MNNSCCTETGIEICVCNNVITQVSNDFLRITGYIIEDILYKNTEAVESLLKARIFSLSIKNGELIEEFIFTKELMPRHVSIGMFLIPSTETIVYYFNRLHDFIFEKKFPLIEEMINNNISGVAVYHVPDMKILRANLNGIEKGFQSNLKLDEFIGKTIFDIDENWKESEACNIVEKTIKNKKQVYENSLYRTVADGQLRFYAATLIPVCEGNKVNYIIAIYKNTPNLVEESNKIELAAKANHKNNENSDKLIKLINIPAIQISYPELEIISYNFKDIHNDYEQICTETDGNKIEVGMDFIAKTFLNQDYNKYIIKMVETKEIVETEVIDMFLDGKKHSFSLIYQPRLNNENNVFEFLIFILNENFKCINNRYDGANKNESEFISYMAHEFKAPLTVMHSAIQLIDFFCHDELSDRAERFINKIRQSSLQQLRLVNNFLDLTKLDSGYLKLNKKNYDIVFMTNAIVNSVSPICENKGITLKFTSTIPCKLVLLDDEKYERILLNILSNAIKFTPSGKNIFVDLSVADNFVCISIKDEGIGIPEDKKHLIFEKFGQVSNGLTRNGEGTGIGLCLAKMLAKSHNGDILLQSEVGKGSEFKIILPEIVGDDLEQENVTLMSNEERLVQSVSVEFSNIYLI